MGVNPSVAVTSLAVTQGVSFVACVAMGTVPAGCVARVAAVAMAATVSIAAGSGAATDALTTGWKAGGWDVGRGVVWFVPLVGVAVGE